ncbi:sulfite exporter TauE/SafE family protein [Candidatus Nitrososphaera gargensis]|nr:sulfite exporter TauE/SafE family protein [Candidatus Nitrososphaera gargensis]
MEEAEIFFFISALIAEIIGTMAGFGSSTIFLPLALLFVDFETAIILTAIFHLFGNIGRITFFRQGFDKRIILQFGVPSVLLSLLGAILMGVFPQPLLKLILGVFLIVTSGSFLARPGLKFPANTGTFIAGGSITGFITALVGTGGALRATMLQGFNIEKVKYIATAATIALATDVTRIPVYISQGFLTEQYYVHIPILFGIALAGSFIGRRMVKRINQELFRRIILVAIILVSIKFIIDGFLILYLVVSYFD